jgi:surfactin synthase thioesterase subunit
MPGTWLMTWHPEPRTRPLLLCVPPAGAGSGQFGQWQECLGGDVAVAGVQLPGREARWSDPEPATIDEVVREVVGELSTLVPAGHPVTVFGHSFGALLGYEITKAVWRAWDSWPCALVLAACRAPEMWVGAGRGLVDDSAELNRLLVARGLSPDDLDEDSRDLMLEVLRRDARLSVSYTGRDLVPAGCPVEAWGGEADETVSPSQLEGWRELAGAGFRVRLFPGGHYFYLDEPGKVPRLLGAIAARSARAGGELA